MYVYLQNMSLLDEQLSVQSVDCEQTPGTAMEHGDDDQPIVLSKAQLNDMVSEAVSAALQGHDESDASEAEECGPDLLDAEIVTADDVSPALAVTIQKRMTEAMPTEVLGKKKELYKAVPANLDRTLNVTRVNTELWSSLSFSAKNKDKRFVWLLIINRH